MTKLALILSVLSCVLATSQQGSGQASPSPAQGTLEERLQQELRQRDAVIRNLLERVQELEVKVNGSASSTAVPVSLGASASATTPTPKTTADYGLDEEEQRARGALDRALLSRGGLLLPKGILELDSRISYFNSSTDAISINGFAILPVLVVGDIVSERVRRDIVLSTLTARLGLPGSMQLDVRMPYGYEVVRTAGADNKQTSRSVLSWGDLDVAVTKQLKREHGGVPDLLASIDFKSKTGKDPFRQGNSEPALGTGFYGLQGSVTAVKSNDPMVLFASLSYAANLPGDKILPANDPQNPNATIAGHFRPGHSIGFQVGSVLAINPETSVTLGWDQRFTRVTTLNGKEIPASFLSEGTLRLGTSYVYAAGKTIDLSFGIGLTRDVPNLQFTVGLPFRFSLWKPAPTRSRIN